MNNLAEKIEITLQEEIPMIKLVSKQDERKLTSRNYFNVAMKQAIAKEKLPDNVKMKVGGRKSLNIALEKANGEIAMEWDGISLIDQNMAKQLVNEVFGYMRTLH